MNKENCNYKLQINQALNKNYSFDQLEQLKQSLPLEYLPSFKSIKSKHSKHSKKLTKEDYYINSNEKLNNLREGHINQNNIPVKQNIVITAPMGTGKTYSTVQRIKSLGGTHVIVCSRKLLCEQYKKAFSSEYKVFCYFGKYKKAGKGINICTFDAFDKVKKILVSKLILIQSIVIEEYHAIIADDGFRSKPNNELVKSLQQYLNISQKPATIYLISSTSCLDSIDKLNIPNLKFYRFISSRPLKKIIPIITKDVLSEVISLTNHYIKDFRVIINYDNKINGCKIIELFKGSSIFYHSDSKEIEFLKHKLIVSTSVIDNGISIEDKIPTKSIIVCNDNNIKTTIQKTGRVRYNNESILVVDEKLSKQPLEPLPIESKRTNSQINNIIGNKSSNSFSDRIKQSLANEVLIEDHKTSYYNNRLDDPPPKGMRYSKTKRTFVYNNLSINYWRYLIDDSFRKVFNDHTSQLTGVKISKPTYSNIIFEDNIFKDKVKGLFIDKIQSISVINCIIHQDTIFDDFIVLKYDTKVNSIESMLDNKSAKIGFVKWLNKLKVYLLNNSYSDDFIDLAEKVSSNKVEKKLRDSIIVDDYYSNQASKYMESRKAIEMMEDFVISLDFVTNNGIIIMTPEEINNFAGRYIHEKFTKSNSIKSSHNTSRDNSHSIRYLFEKLLDTVDTSLDENYRFVLDTFDDHRNKYFGHKKDFNALIKKCDIKEVPLFVIYDYQDLLKEYIREYKPYARKLLPTTEAQVYLINIHNIKVSRDTLIRWIKQHGIGIFRNRKYLVDLAKLELFLKKDYLTVQQFMSIMKLKNYSYAINVIKKYKLGIKANQWQVNKQKVEQYKKDRSNV